MRFTVRRLLIANVVLATGLAWMAYLFDRDSAYRTAEKGLAVFVVALGVPAVVMGLSAGRRRGLFRAAVAAHLGLMALICAAPLLLIGYFRVYHPLKVSPGRMAWLGMAIGPCAGMTLLYGAGCLFVAFPPRRRRDQPSGVKPRTTLKFAANSPIFEPFTGTKSTVTASRALGSRRLR